LTTCYKRASPRRRSSSSKSPASYWRITNDPPMFSNTSVCLPCPYGGAKSISGCVIIIERGRYVESVLWASNATQGRRYQQNGKMCALRLSWPTGLAALSLIVFHKHRSTENNHFYTIEDVRNLVCGLAIDKIAGPKRHPRMFGT
jgi:hypothetical protein